ncbi:MAG TPA: Uma2 family endonuclease [Chryseosolibacter sp.]|nr:Uma2 family endonuclease [Chryseosolibacter sp.]
MKRDIDTPPRTIMEVFQMLPAGTLAEVIDGTLYMSPAPNTNHQRTLANIYSQLLKQNIGGEFFISPYDVFLDETSNAVQPDLVFVSTAKSSIIKADAIHGVPDLIIEILSPGNATHDTVKKKALFEKHGVTEYWIADPETKESIGYCLKDKIYVECGRFTGVIRSVLLNAEMQF